MPRLEHVFDSPEWQMLTFNDLRMIFANTLMAANSGERAARQAPVSSNSGESLEDKLLRHEEKMMQPKIYGEHTESPNNLASTHPRFWQAMPPQAGSMIWKERAGLNFQTLPTMNWDLTDCGTVELDPRAWVEIANLGSQTISITMMIVNKKASKNQAMSVQQGEDGTQTINFVTPQEVFSNVDEIQSALVLLMMCRRRYFPGDESIGVLIYFLTSHNWFFALVKQLNRGTYNQGLHLLLLQTFINEVLRQNGRNFRKCLPFETYDRMLTRLQSLIRADNITRINAQLAATRGNNNNQSQFRRQGQNQRPQQTGSGVNHVPQSNGSFGDRLCRWFNNGTCNRNVSNNRCITSKGMELLHKCSFKYPSGRFCGRLHPECEHGQQANNGNKQGGNNNNSNNGPKNQKN